MFQGCRLIPGTPAGDPQPHTRRVGETEDLELGRWRQVHQLERLDELG